MPKDNENPWTKWSDENCQEIEAAECPLGGVYLDLESDPNAAIVKYPYGYAEFRGSRYGRERCAKVFIQAMTGK